ncbi:lipase member I precursor [Mus musculus]|uniref:Lipase member H n=2 Tax=Mus musculus TaxID=10090 RepID=F6YQT7_MOUSE|nr:lipase member I precursor [Mus musculus]EDK98267.1 RIKEN cDNA D930038D03 [Mus musculus]|eukprot:NP_001239442.1 lipase member I precursor [Mus musculus]
MRIYIFLCLICWARFGYLNFQSNTTGVSKDPEKKRTCLEFTKLSAMNSLKDLFCPKVKINLLMYSRGNAKCAEPLFESNNSLNTRFNPAKKTVWIIHGYRPFGSTPVWLSRFTKAFLKQEDVNLIVVDWNQGATTFMYSRAVRNTRRVAEILRETIENLLIHGASLDNFHFIGMSLGAHISGFVGKIFHGQLGRITGLDPAGPQFSRKPSNSRLYYTDAKFVDVIHTDIKSLGIGEPSGHIDFYPNGGKHQPGCPTSIFSGTNFIKCDHQRAIYLFLAAFETSCNFVSFPCRSYKDYKNGLCVDCGNLYKDSCPRLGNQAKLWKEELKKKTEEWPLRTTAFLDTSSQNPFCTYYFALNIVALSETMRNGSISFGLLNDLGDLEYSTLYEKSKPFDNLQEVKILVQFVNDIVSISRICLTYFQSTNPYCAACQYKIQSLVLKSLTYPERPPICKYNFVLKEGTRVDLQPDECNTQME